MAKTQRGVVCVLRNHPCIGLWIFGLQHAVFNHTLENVGVIQQEKRRVLRQERNHLDHECELHLGDRTSDSGSGIGKIGLSRTLKLSQLGRASSREA